MGEPELPDFGNLLETLCIQRIGVDRRTMTRATQLLDAAGFLSADELAIALHIGVHNAQQAIDAYLDGTPGARQRHNQRVKAQEAPNAGPRRWHEYSR